MPGLLDLPVELLEQIYDIIEESTNYHDRHDLGYFSLTSRYMERATRRSFRLYHFSREIIRTSNDENPEKFCEYTTVPDLAKTLERLILYADDDGTTGINALSHMLHCGGANLFSVGRDSKPADVLDELLPTPLRHHRDALIKALRACENVTELEFCDNQMFDDDFEASRERPKPAALRPVRFSRWTFGRDKHISDITSTFNFILSLMAEADLYPRWISIHPLSEYHMQTDITNAVGLVKWKKVLTKVESIELTFLADWRDDVHSHEEAGTRIGRQLCESIQSFPLLTKLVLSFNLSRTSLTAWEQLDEGPAFPALEQLRLNDCTIGVDDFTKFVLKQHGTLRTLDLWIVELEGGGGVDELRRFFCRLRAFQKLERFTGDLFFLDGGRIEFPAAQSPLLYDLADEDDGWV